MAAESVRSRRRKVIHVARFKAERGCARCGETHPACLELHHPGERHQDRSGRSRRNWESMSWGDLAVELARCEVICANCHRKENAKEQEWYTGDAEYRKRGSPVVHTPPPDGDLLAMKAAGMTDKQIGAQFGCSHETVRRWRKGIET